MGKKKQREEQSDAIGKRVIYHGKQIDAPGTVVEAKKIAKDEEKWTVRTDDKMMVEADSKYFEVTNQNERSDKKKRKG